MNLRKEIEKQKNKERKEKLIMLKKRAENTKMIDEYLSSPKFKALKADVERIVKKEIKKGNNHTTLKLTSCTNRFLNHTHFYNDSEYDEDTSIGCVVFKLEDRIQLDKILEYFKSEGYETDLIISSGYRYKVVSLKLFWGN